MDPKVSRQNPKHINLYKQFYNKALKMCLGLTVSLPLADDPAIQPSIGRNLHGLLRDFMW